MTGNKKVFPIHNDSACVLKWGWNTFRVHTGASSSCHRVKSEVVDPENFENFHNLPAVLKDREQMRNGQWPDAGRGCEYCRVIEDAGGESDRTYHNKISGLTPIDFTIDGNDVVTPRISEVYLSNTCDLACVYCGPNFSSRINKEIKEFGHYPVGNFSAYHRFVEKRPDTDVLLDKYKSWLDNNYQKIQRISILGGEPLLQKELWELLSVIKNKQNSDLELAINTNLNARPQDIEKFVKIVKDLVSSRKLSKVNVNASLDCWGPQAEFIRNGLSLDAWKRNFEFLLEHKWISVTVHQVITSLSLGTMIDLQKLIGSYKINNPKILQAYHMVDSGQELVFHPEIFGSEFFSEQYQELVDTYPVATEWDKIAKNRLVGFANIQKQAKVDVNRMQLLKQTLDMIDTRRGTDWKVLFPHIVEHFAKHGI